MPTPWAQVASSPAYMALPPDQQAAAKKQYFDQVVAPKVPKDQVDVVRQQFEQSTSAKPGASADAVPGNPASAPTGGPPKPAAPPGSPPAYTAPRKPVFGDLERMGMGALTPLVGIGQGGVNMLHAVGLASDAENKGANDAAASFSAAKKRLQDRDSVGSVDVPDMIGQAANPINYVGKGGALLKSGISGMISGGTQPSTSDHPLYDHLKGAVIGGATGLGVGVAFKALSAGARAIIDTVAPAMGKDAAIHQAAVAKVLSRFEQDAKGGGPSATQAIAAVNTARARGTPMALADAGGKNVQGLAGSLARQPGTPKAMAEANAQAQMREAGKRLSDIGAQHITSGPTMRQSVDALTAGQKAAAAPLYEKAFDTRSTAPLIPSIQKTMAEATAAEHAATKSVAEAKATLAGLRKPPTPKATDEKIGPSLLEFISKRGGVIDKGGDLKSMGADRWHVGKPGTKKLIVDAPEDAGAGLPGMTGGTGKRNDKGLDDVTRAAWEAGYLGDADRPDTNALLDKIGDELRGSKVHTLDDQVRLRNRDEAGRYADFIEDHKQLARQTAESMGSKLTSSEEHHAAELIAGGSHPEEAVRDAENSSANDMLVSDQKRSQQAYQTQRVQRSMKEIEKAKQTQAQAQDAMRQALTDQSVGRKGGVWSPRIQQIISDPIMKPAIARGLEVQRLEALASGKPFNPRDYAVTGTDKEGNPIVDKVPNMRLLHSVKMGMDAIVEDFRDPMTGKLNFMNSGERGQVARNLDSIRRSYLSEIDKINPDYKAARAAWAGPAQAKGIIAQGRNIFREHPEDVKKIWDRLSPADREYYKIGVADWWRDEIAKAGPKAAAARGMSKNDFNDMIKDRLRPLFDSQEKFDHFVDAVTDERTVFVQAGKRLGGSQTAERQTEDGYEGLSAAAHGARAVGHLAEGNWMTAAMSLAKMKKDLGIIGDQKVNDAMAKLMFSPTIDLNSPQGLKLLRAIPSPKARAYLENFRRAGAVVAGSRQGQEN